jgi:hypothetical protein
VRLKNPKPEDLFWMGQVNTKNGTASDEIVKEHAKVIKQQNGVSNFVYKSWYYIFCSKK